MKKKIIYSSVLTALLSASTLAFAGGPDVILPPEPDYFSGFYIGGFGGVHHNTFNTTSSVDQLQPWVINATNRRDIRPNRLPFTPIENFIDSLFPVTVLQQGNLNTNSTSSGEYDGYGGIQGGWGTVFRKRFYAGIVGWGEWGTTNSTVTQSATIPSFGNQRTFPVFIPIFRPPVQIGTLTFINSSSASANTSTNTKISNDEGVAAKLGYLLTPTTLLYGKIGPSWASISINNSTTANASNGRSINFTNNTGTFTFTNAVSRSLALSGNSSGSSDDKCGLLLGAGVEQFVWDRVVSIFGEFNYTNYGHVSAPVSVLTGTSTFNRNIVINGTSVFNRTIVNPNITTNTGTSASSDVQTSVLMAGVNIYLNDIGLGSIL